MAERIPANFRRVITAAAGGNVIEWYDFYIFGSLATILSVKFFEKSHPVAACSARSRCSPPGSWSGRWGHLCSAGWETWSAASIPSS
jgi:hypothetical protein